ncbi:MAG: tripartite tricarboxylate transporter substrate binding protein, partial [Proteobacteria bacterium]|nr:tripartite tricarboxylate transporter substrate binding protein [Pseudomonadota bacterium]
MTGKALWNAIGEKTAQEHKPTSRIHATQQALVIAGAILSAFLLITIWAAPLSADSYPNKPIRFILPYAPGGAVDTVGRIIAQKLADGLGQPVVPENKPGAGSTIGTELVVRSKPDGYTLVMGSASITITPSLYKLSYDPRQDLAPVAICAMGSQVLLVHPSLPVNDIKELVAYAKANPGKLNFGTGGVGNPGHLAVELLKSLAQIDLVHVPYKGAGPAMVGLVSGEVKVQASSIPAAVPHIQSGKVKALAVLGEKRSFLLSNVPTAKEAGMENLVVTSRYGFLAPAGTPRDIIDRLNAVWVKAAAMPDTREKLMKVGEEPLASTPEEYQEFLKTEIPRWAKVIKEANIKRP